MTSSGVYTIAEVEAMTGLSAEVLRQWERRYGFPKPRRTPGGHRLYSAEDVEALKTIKRWLEEGATPKAAIRRYLAQEVRPEDLGTGLLEALLRGDLVTTPPGERHEIGAMLAAYHLRRKGVPALYKSFDLLGQKIIEHAGGKEHRTARCIDF